MRNSTVPFPFQLLEENQFALDRLDLRFRWGHYGIRVLHCHLATFAPGQTVGFHKHSDYEFHFIPRGKGTVILDGTEFELHEGLFYLTGPGVVHYQASNTEDPMDELCLHIAIEELPCEANHSADTAENWGAELEAQEAKQCVLQLQDFPRHILVDQHNAMQWFLTAYRAWYENKIGAFTTIKQAITQIIMRSVQNVADHQGPFDIPQRNMNEHRFRLATQFIQDNYAAAITVDDVADRLHISGRQLQRIFQQFSKDSFRNYLETIRLSHVCQDLLKNQRSLEQIAVEHGFSSSNYLYYVFKRKTGMTPGQFKERYTKSAQLT